jgi:hypothetical protein
MPHGRQLTIPIGAAVKTMSWLEDAVRDAERRGLPDLRPLLEALARATVALRAADWNLDATDSHDTHGQG